MKKSASLLTSLLMQVAVLNLSLDPLSVDPN